MPIAPAAGRQHRQQARARDDFEHLTLRIGQRVKNDGGAVQLDREARIHDVDRHGDADLQPPLAILNVRIVDFGHGRDELQPRLAVQHGDGQHAQFVALLATEVAGKVDAARRSRVEGLPVLGADIGDGDNIVQQGLSHDGVPSRSSKRTQIGCMVQILASRCMVPRWIRI